MSVDGRSSANPTVRNRIDAAEGERNGCCVVIKAIRKFHRAVPFVPYEIHTVSGETYRVPHPDFIIVSPRGSYVIVIDAEERPHHLNVLLMERASLPDSDGQRSSRRQNRSDVGRP
jgi:hypothetical protein